MFSPCVCVQVVYEREASVANVTNISALFVVHALVNVQVFLRRELLAALLTIERRLFGANILGSINVRLFVTFHVIAGEPLVTDVALLVDLLARVTAHVLTQVAGRRERLVGAQDAEKPESEALRLPGGALAEA